MIFVDTGAWYALVVEDDFHHQPAVKVFSEIAKGRHGRMLSSDHVVLETANFLLRRMGLQEAQSLLDLLRRKKALELVWITEPNFQGRLELLHSRRDKKWSLTDCTSFVLMRSLDVSTVFTFDDDFSQAGFRRLPAA